jgi:endonuclease/exonuclease/phosphatase (EEP) superfamily protein YafD
MWLKLPILSHHSPKSKLALSFSAIVVILSFLSLVAGAGKYLWIVDLASHFRLQYSIFLLLLTPMVLALGNRKVAAFGLLALIVNLAEVMPFSLPHSSFLNSSGSSRLKVLSINVNFLNRNFDQILKCARRFDPDLIAIEELTPELNAALSANLPEFKFRCVAPRTDPYGIGVFSRIPMSDASIVDYVSNVPSVTAQLVWQDQSIFLVATHPRAPLTAQLASDNEAQLKAIADQILLRKDACLVIGDFNATPWCSSYKAIIATTGMVDSSRGFGIVPTWLRGFPLLCLPIDNCLTTPDMITVKRIIGPDIGSDHSPLYVELVNRVPLAQVPIEFRKTNASKVTAAAIVF